MQVGDHLVTPRTGYTHHGIYLGDGQVIHYKGFSEGFKRDVIGITPLAEFSCGHEIQVESHLLRRFSREESIERAYSRLGEDWYDVILNNCEHFVYWCITGCHISPQVNKATISVAAMAKAEKVMNVARQLLAQQTFKQGCVVAADKAATKTLTSVIGKAATQTLVKGGGKYVASSFASTAIKGATAKAAVSSGAGIAAGLTSGGVAAGMGVSGGTLIVSVAGASAATVVAPLAIAGAVGFGVYKIFKWATD